MIGLKRNIVLLMFLPVLVIMILGCTSKNQASNSNEYVIDQSDFINANEFIENIEKSDLSDEEISGLVLMREEEKLARDVYLKLYEIWGSRIFYNVAESEQTHTNAVKVLLDRYNIEDPVKDDSIGVFTSQELLKLYEDLVSDGSSSLLNALIVGATIEDLDIKDLNDLLEKTDNEDITIIYNTLVRGSRNHLRAYVKQINYNGGSYSPKYISQEEFNTIISSPQETGRI